MPRDPRRIRRILSQLEALWMTSPDLRLGQLILNAAKRPDQLDYSFEDYIEHCNAQGFCDIYNVEDEELVSRVSTYMKKGPV